MKKTLLVLFLGLGTTVLVDGDDNDSLSADASSDQIATAVENQAGSIYNKHADDGFDSPWSWVYRREEIKKAAAEIEAASPKAILDALDQTEQYDAGADYKPKLILKRQILAKALMTCATDATLPDLLHSQSAEALWVVCSHPDWHNNPAVTAFLTDQLGDMPSNEADDRTPQWVADFYVPRQNFLTMSNDYWVPGQNWEWSVLDLASQDDNPGVQKLLVDTIQRALDRAGTRAIFLCNALNAVSNSTNPRIVLTTI